MAVKFNKVQVDDIREKGAGFNGDDIDKHPSYGMVSLGQTHFGGTGGGTTLFGSGVKHGTAISLKINYAERHRSAYHDSYFSKNRIIEIYVSASQFTTLLTKMNTTGVPCTLNWTAQDGHIESPPEHNVKQEMQTELKAKYADLAARVQSLEVVVQTALKGPVKATDKVKILNSVHKISQDVSGNMAFLQKCHTKTLEGIGSEIIAEAEAQLSGMITAVGLEHLQGQAKQLTLNNIKEITDGD